MRYYQYFLKILLKYKWVLLVTVGIPVVAAVFFCKLSTPLYESITEIYPLVMKKDAEMTPLNPCYQVQRIVHSAQFRQLLVDANISPSLNRSNYDRRILCHETPRHTLVISARAETPEAADALARQLLDQLNFAGRQLSSLRLAVDSGLCEQIPWDYYHHQVDFAPESPVRDSCDTVRTHFLFDILSEPFSESTPIYPHDLLKTIVFVFLISAFISFIGVCIAEEIRQRLKNSRPEQE